MKALGIVTWIVISTLFGALFNAWALHMLWHWFVSMQYGAGPSMAAWFGLASIGRIVTHQVQGSSSSKDKEWSDILTDQIAWYLGVLMVLGAAWATGAVFGWLSW